MAQGVSLTEETDLKPSSRPALKPSTLIPLQRSHHHKSATVCLSNGSDNSASCISVAFCEISSTNSELLLPPSWEAIQEAKASLISRMPIAKYFLKILSSIH